MVKSNNSLSNPTMINRIITAVLGVPLVIIVILLGNPLLSLFVAILALLGIIEFNGLARKRNLESSYLLSIPWTLAFVLVTYLITQSVIGTEYLIFTFLTGLIISLIWLIIGKHKKNPYLAWSYSIIGPIYIGLFLSYIILTRDLAQGSEWVLVMIIGVFSTDTFAFFAGKTFGKHKLAPTISPGKTMEGSLLGFLAAPITVMLASFILNLNLEIWQSIFLGILIGIFSQIGDLIESYLKRLSNVKDSGHLIPGHGGILDRIDSIVLNTMIVYYFAIWVT